MIRNTHTYPSFRNSRLRDVASAAVGGAISAGVNLAIAGAQTWLASINASHAQMSSTTEIVNGWATQMGNLTRAYLSEPNPTCADQRAALDAFDQSWAWLQSGAACGNGAYGAAGLACISDRAPGGKFDATKANRDPIANDPRLAAMNCDTSSELLLPSLTTGTYSASGLTAGGQPDTTTNASSAAAASGGIAIAPAATIVTGVPTVYVYGALALVAFLFLRPSQ